MSSVRWSPWLPTRSPQSGDSWFHWARLDAEHGALTVESVQGLIRAAGTGSACVRRPRPGVDDAATSTRLTPAPSCDGAAGAHGQLAADAVRLVALCAEGARGMGVARAHRYGFGVTEYLASANDLGPWSWSRPEC